MNNFLKEIIKLTEELNNTKGINTLIVFDEIETLYNNHIKELQQSKQSVNEDMKKLMRSDSRQAVCRDYKQREPICKINFNKTQSTPKEEVGQITKLLTDYENFKLLTPHQHTCSDQAIDNYLTHIGQL